jgi:hypothetical protein
MKTFTFDVVIDGPTRQELESITIKAATEILAENKLALVMGQKHYAIANVTEIED